MNSWDLPPGTTQHHIDEEFREPDPKEKEKEPYFVPEEGCSAFYSLCVLEELTGDLLSGGGISLLEAKNIHGHLLNLRMKLREGRVA